MSIKYLLGLLLSVTILLSCSDDDKNYDELIVDTWYVNSGFFDEAAGQSFREEIVFNSNASYEKRLLIVESNDPNMVIGYMYLIRGNYAVIDDELHMTNIHEYNLDNENDYLNRNDLVLSEFEPGETIIRISIENDKLTIHFDCPNSMVPSSLSSCIDQLQYDRLKN